MRIIHNNTSYTAEEIEAALKAFEDQPYMETDTDAPELWNAWEKVYWVQSIDMPGGNRVRLAWTTTEERWQEVEETGDEGDACDWDCIYSACYED